ncbi:hypothetical protein MHU86_16607 [Fragilaria crotonensis]|nr:hypothetical protein MHU86_16607 [Fragilaria crotonensis]
MDAPEDKVKTEGIVDTASPKPSHEGKPAKTPVLEAQTDHSIRAASPDSLIGESFLAASVSVVPAPPINVPNAPSTRIPERKRLSSPPSAEALSPPISPIESKAMKSASIPANSSNQIKAGRPPRAPTGDVHSQTKPTKDSAAQPPTVHTRGISAGEYSTMSGLTDPMLDETEPRQPQRPRGVSFGEEVEELSPGSTRDVPLKDSSSRPRPILTGDVQRSTRLISSPQKASNAVNRVEEKFAMATIVNPIESEAEKAILRALEDRERNVTHSTAAAVLPNVPDDVIVSLGSRQ